MASPCGSRADTQVGQDPVGTPEVQTAVGATRGSRWPCHDDDVRSRLPKDPNLLAIPAFFACMLAEHRWQRRRAARAVQAGANGLGASEAGDSGGGAPEAGDYEWRDTLASLTMGTASLVTPIVIPRLLRPFALGRGRYGKHLAVGALGAAAVATGAGLLARRRTGPAGARWAVPGPSHTAPPPTGDGQSAPPPAAAEVDRPQQSQPDRADQLASAAGVAAVILGGVVVSATWATVTTAPQFWRHRLFGTRGKGPLALLAAIAGWDFIYYWNHRLGHESRYLWAVHVVHHSSERYNFSTALRQPVLDDFGPYIPYGVLCLFGMAPEAVLVARSVNLLYQFWIHTESIGRLGRPEEVLNSPSHHRVHHGSNSQYLDRNYGSILIVWDRLFGTFEPEGERVVYGLTRNIGTFNPGRIALHEHAQMLRGVAGSTTWGERLSYVFRGPGWAYRHDEERLALADAAEGSSARPSSPAEAIRATA